MKKTKAYIYSVVFICVLLLGFWWQRRKSFLASIDEDYRRFLLKPFSKAVNSKLDGCDLFAEKVITFSSTSSFCGNVTLVLFATVQDIDRVLLLIHSLREYGIPGRTELFDNGGYTNCPIIVIVPDDHVRSFKNHLETPRARVPPKHPGIRFKIISDSVLLSDWYGNPDQYNIVDKNHHEEDDWMKRTLKSQNNYPRQMLLKLLASRVVYSRFYLTLDSDILLMRPFSWKEFIIKNDYDDMTATLEAEQREAHPNWWQASARILKVEKCDPAGKPLIGVTPALLSKHIATLTVCKLYSMYNNEFGLKGEDAFTGTCGAPFVSYLSDILYAKVGITWTEYSLYRIVGCQYDLLEKYHHFGNSLSRGIWTLSELDQAKRFPLAPSEVMSRPPWLVVQTRLSPSLRDVQVIYQNYKI